MIELAPARPSSCCTVGPAITDVSLEMLDGVGHYTPLEAPDRLARAIKKRLARTAFS
jgi:pimeloyl-ACP methyl ester carboxylesterase